LNVIGLNLDSTDDLFKPSAYLTEAYLLNQTFRHSDSPSASPFNLAFNTKSDFFSWLEEEGNEMRVRRFGHAMIGTTNRDVSQVDGEQDVLEPYK